MRLLINCALTVFLTASAAFPEALIHPHPGQRPRSGSFWKSSAIALLASSAADMHSSLGRREMNPLLANSQGRFSGRGIAIKALITGGALGAQWLILRRNPEAQKYAAVANFGMAAIFTTAARHNYANYKPSPSFDQPFVPSPF